MNSTKTSGENPFLHSAINELCIVCNKKIEEHLAFSINDILPESSPQFMHLHQKYCPPQACSTCFKKANEILHFQRLCNNSVERIKSFLSQHDVDKGWPTNANCIDAKGTIHKMSVLEGCPDVVQFLSVEIEADNKLEKQTNDTDDNVNNANSGSNDDNINEYCAYQQKNDKNLKKQKLDLGDSRRPRVECELCHKTFNSNYIRIHRRIHTGEKPYICKTCGQKFKSSVERRQHTIMQHQDGRKFLCTICGKSFKLLQHFRAHCRIHEEGQFICDVCGKAFRTRFKRQEHYTSHTGERTFLCAECPKSFGTQKSLRQHEVTHAKVKPIKCECCGRGFTQRHALKSHLVKSCKGENKQLVLA